MRSWILVFWSREGLRDSRRRENFARNDKFLLRKASRVKLAASLTYNDVSASPPQHCDTLWAKGGKAINSNRQVCRITWNGFSCLQGE